MTEPFRQPVKKRIQDIMVYGIFFAFMSLLSGTWKILMFTLPVFLILASILATGRYKYGKTKEKTYRERQQVKQKKIFSGCKNLSTREHTLGY